MKFILILAASVILTSSAHASLFDLMFSTDPDGVVADTITGTLVGLQNGTDVDPSQIIITSAPASFNITEPLTFTPLTYETGTVATGIQSTTTVGVYGFNITGGVVQPSTNVAFYDAGGNGVGFNFYDGNNGAEFNGVYDYASTGPSGATFTPVPEIPQTALLCLTGLILLIGVRKLTSRRLAPALG